MSEGSDEALAQTVRQRVVDILQGADLATTTERGICEQLQAELGTPMTPYKPFIKVSSRGLEYKYRAHAAARSSSGSVALSGSREAALHGTAS